MHIAIFPGLVLIHPNPSSKQISGRSKQGCPSLYIIIEIGSLRQLKGSHTDPGGLMNKQLSTGLPFIRCNLAHIISA